MIKTALRAAFFIAKLQKPESNGYVNHTVSNYFGKKYIVWKHSAEGGMLL